MFNILVVEDNFNKMNKVIDCINSNLSDVNLEVGESFTSGWKKINSKHYDLICLDMSLPTFDQSDSEVGGRFRVFGGRELAQKMKRKNIKSKYIFITHYKNFSDHNKSYSFDELKVELLDSFKESCIDVIFFSNKSSEWRDTFSNHLVELNR